jgi:predicted DNA-binding transcriptional regulator YafY
MNNKNAIIRYRILDSILASRTPRTIKIITELINNQLGQDGYRLIIDRTVRNDMEDIQTIFGVEIEKVSNSRYRYADPHDSVFKNKLSPETIEFLEMALAASKKSFAGTSIFDRLDGAISNMMAGSILRNAIVDKPNRYIQFEAPKNNGGHSWLEKMFTAIKKQNAVSILYESYGKEPHIRTISPYALKENGGNWYTIAFSHDHGETRIFKLGRIKKMELVKVEYIYDEKFDLDSYFKHSLGLYNGTPDELIKVKLKVAKSHMFLVAENPLHNNMETISKSENELIIRFETYNTIELKNLILRYGEGVTVIEPLSFRQEIAGYIDKMRENYIDE